MLLLTIALATLVGLTLGLVGGGGSMLTTPILLYAAKLPPKSAIASSLAVVAITAASALVSHARAGHVRWKVGLGFGGLGMAGAVLGAKLAEHIPALVQLVLFALVMLLMGYLLLRPGKAQAPQAAPARHWGRLAIAGSLTGVFTGVIGAGGGFVVVPALTLFGGLPLRQAIGTSLLVITLQASAGFVGQVRTVGWQPALVLSLAASAAIGSVVGSWLSHRVSVNGLRAALGVLVVGVAVFLLGDQLVHALVS